MTRVTVEVKAVNGLKGCKAQSGGAPPLLGVLPPCSNQRATSRPRLRTLHSFHSAVKTSDIFRSSSTTRRRSSTGVAAGRSHDPHLTCVRSLQRLSTDYQRVADSLRAYGAEEGDDLNDILGKSSLIMGQVATAITQLGTHENAVRGHMKAIRTREENLTELRARRKNVGTKAEAAEKKLSKMSGEVRVHAAPGLGSLTSSALAHVCSTRA